MLAMTTARTVDILRPTAVNQRTLSRSFSLVAGCTPLTAISARLWCFVRDAFPFLFFSQTPEASFIFPFYPLSFLKSPTPTHTTVQRAAMVAIHPRTPTPTQAPIPIESLPAAATGLSAPPPDGSWTDDGVLGITLVACAMLALVLAACAVALWPRVRTWLPSRKAEGGEVVRSRGYAGFGAKVRMDLGVVVKGGLIEGNLCRRMRCSLGTSRIRPGRLFCNAEVNCVCSCPASKLTYALKARPSSSCHFWLLHSAGHLCVTITSLPVHHLLVVPFVLTYIFVNSRKEI